MSNCPIGAWIILKEAKNILKQGYRIPFYNLILNQIKDYLYQQLGIAQQLVTDIASIIESVIIALENAINFAASPKEWMCFVLDEQISVMDDSLNREIDLISNIISKIDGMQRRLKIDDKNYERMSRTLHKWLQSSYRDLEECYRNSDNIFTFEQRFSSSYNKMQIIKIMLEFKQRKANIDALLGDIRREFGDTIENKGDPVRKVDHGAIMRAIIDDQKRDAIDAINFIDNWIYFLNSYIQILKDYMGCDLGVIINPFTSNLETLLQNTEEDPIHEWSLKSLTREIDWTECVKEITLKALFSDKDTDTVTGNRRIYIGAKIIIDALRSTIGDVEGSPEVWKSVPGDLKDAADELMKDKIFTQIIEDEDFTEVGKNVNGYDLIESRNDKLKQLLKANKILLDYQLTDGTLLSNAITSTNTKDFLAAIKAAMDEIDALNDDTIKSILRGENAYQTYTIGEFMDAADTRGLASVVELGARSAIGMLNYNNLQKHIEYFEARRAVISEYRRIIKKIPTYRNEHINQLIEVLTEFGFVNLVQNLRKGVSLFDQVPLSSAVGLAAEAAAVLSVLYDCLDLAKTPEQLKKITKLISNIKIDIGITRKLNFEKGINGILKALGLKFDWIKRMLSKKDESDDLLVKLEYINGLIRDMA